MAYQEGGALYMRDWTHASLQDRTSFHDNTATRGGAINTGAYAHLQATTVEFHANIADYGGSNTHSLLMTE